MLLPLVFRDIYLISGQCLYTVVPTIYLLLLLLVQFHIVGQRGRLWSTSLTVSYQTVPYVQLLDSHPRTRSRRMQPPRQVTIINILTLPPGWTGSYTCPALRPYQLGQMRVPECNHKATGSGYKAVDGCEAINRWL